MSDQSNRYTYMCTVNQYDGIYRRHAYRVMLCAKLNRIMMTKDTIDKIVDEQTTNQHTDKSLEIAYHEKKRGCRTKGVNLKRKRPVKEGNMSLVHVDDGSL